VTRVRRLGLAAARRRPRVAAPVDPPPTSPTGPIPLMGGVHRHLVWNREGSSFGAIGLDVNAKLQAMNTAIVRVDTEWSGFEPRAPINGVRTFVTDPWAGKLTNGLKDLRDRGIKVMVAVNSTPTWESGHTGVRVLPKDPNSVGPFAKWLVETYSPANGYDNIIGFEYYNEPNLAGFDELGPRPAHYANCLKVFYDAVKASSNPTAKVIKCGQAENAVSANGAATDLRFHFDNFIYQRVAAAGWGYFPWDVWGTHCYPGTNPPSAVSPGNAYYLLDHLRYLFAEMVRRGDTSDVWITEGGYSAHSNTIPSALGEPPSWQAGVSEQQRVDYTLAYFDRLRRDFPRVKAAIMYNDWGKGNALAATSNVDRHEFGYGLLDHQRATTLPIYSALRGKYADLHGLQTTAPTAPPEPAPATWPTAYTRLSNIEPAAALTEVSGMVMSTRHTDVAYVHDDSSTNHVEMVNVRTGKRLATITLAGVPQGDWEDITRGPNGTLLVGDIGDNARNRTNQRLYGFPEPTTIANVTVTPTIYPVRFSDGVGQDCESLLCDPVTGRCFLASKRTQDELNAGLVAKWYEGPTSLSTSGNVFTLTSRKHPGNQFGGDWAPDGQTYVLQHYLSARVYDRNGVELKRSPYSQADLVQAESVCFVPGQVGALVSTETTATTGPPIFYLPL